MSYNKFSMHTIIYQYVFKNKMYNIKDIYTNNANNSRIKYAEDLFKLNHQIHVRLECLYISIFKVTFL